MENFIFCAVPFACYYSIFLGIGSLVFLYFAWSLGTMKTKNWRSQFFWEYSRLPENRPKTAQSGPFCPICSFPSIGSFFAFDILHDVEGP